MFPFFRLPFGASFHERLASIVQMAKLLWLILAGLVFLYALFVLSVWLGYIPLNFDGISRIDVLNKLKYILLSVSLLIYPIIRLIKYIIAWLYNKKYLCSVSTLFIVSFSICALCEAVSIYGLVMFMVSRNPADYFLFMVISLFYFYSFYPKYEDWERLLNQEFEATPSPS
jgi:hypothetical protein